MTPIHKLLIGTALTTLTAAAFAQTPAPDAGSMNSRPPSGAPDMSHQTPDVAGLRDEPPAPQRLTATRPNDPLVQKRDEDTRANAQYRQDKKSAKSAYKRQVKSAKTQRKSDRQAANDQMKEEMHGVPAQGQAGTQRP